MKKRIAISVLDFCHFAGVGRTTTYGLIAQGKLKTAKVGRRRLIILRSAKAYIRSVVQTDEGAQ